MQKALKIAGSRSVFVSIDIDSVAQCFAPGCSAPDARGFSPEQIREFAFLAGASKAVKLLDIVTDQTPAHDLSSYVPVGNLEELDKLRETDREEYHRRALSSIRLHVEAILEMQRRGAVVFDYGNNLRAQAERAGVDIRDEKGGFKYKGFVLEYIRPLFCVGKGPFRWAALSGDSEDIEAIAGYEGIE